MRLITKRIDHRSAILLLVAASSMAAQQQTETAKPRMLASKPGVVSGRVFAITGGGDMKPARLARVYLFYAGRNDEEAKTSVGMTWLNENVAAVEAQVKLVEAERETCAADMLTYDKAILATLKWGEDQKKANQILTADADEEGNFKITSVTPGFYVLLARGRSGFSEGIWSQTIKVESGREAIVKLASPEKACLLIKH